MFAPSARAFIITAFEQGLLTPESTYRPTLPAMTSRSGLVGFRPRSQRRDRDGFSPSSPHPKLTECSAPAPGSQRRLPAFDGERATFQSPNVRTFGSSGKTWERGRRAEEDSGSGSGNFRLQVQLQTTKAEAVAVADAAAENRCVEPDTITSGSFLARFARRHSPPPASKRWRLPRPAVACFSLPAASSCHDLEAHQSPGGVTTTEHCRLDAVTDSCRCPCRRRLPLSSGPDPGRCPCLPWLASHAIPDESNVRTF
jgi:hypothetical protein